MEDLVSNVPDVVDSAKGAAAVAGGWLATKFQWWKNLKDTKTKVLIGIGLVAGIFILLTMIFGGGSGAGFGPTAR